ncbi:hypothetical protein Q7A53_06190 [Halobacillus rhizosphaerae]|uniref:hypothetical protein n=1 Tax=Halobacillus rhizosphaerae TaxID=3064889 RepID=UPI00398B4ABE
MTENNSLFAFDSEQEAKRVLMAEGRRLKYIALKIWRRYLSSYKPEAYIRTRKSQNAIKLGHVKKVGSDTLGIELTFDDNLLYHDSVISKSEPKGHSIMLISEGWKVKRGRAKDVYRFGYFEGINYIERVKEAFESGKHKGITLVVNWQGEEFRKQPQQKGVLKK